MLPYGTISLILPCASKPACRVLPTQIFITADNLQLRADDSLVVALLGILTIYLEYAWIHNLGIIRCIQIKRAGINTNGILTIMSPIQTRLSNRGMTADKNM